MKKIVYYWPAIFIVILWSIFASPYFFRGKVPYPSTYQVNFFPPWSAYEKFWGPIKNNAMPDVIDQIYPWKHFTIETWKKGEVPLWNPYSFSGNPHLANFQSAVLSPFNALYFFLPFVDAWSINVLLQPLLAGVFMYFLMRAFNVEQTGALISGIVFMFCGFVVVWMAYGTLSMAIAILPLTIFCIEKSFQRLQKRWLAILSISLPLSLFSGHFQTSLYFFLFSLAFIIFKSLTGKKAKRSLVVFCFFFLGVGLSMPQILPSIELYSQAVRSEIFTTGGAIPLRYLVTFFAPDFYGNPVTRNDWFGYYAEWSSFIGILPFLLALFAIFQVRSNLSFFFSLSGILAILLALDTPLQNFIVFLKIPVIATSIPSRIIVLFSFSFAILAGLGLGAVKKLVEKGEKKRIFIIICLTAIPLVIAWLLLLFKTLPPDKAIISQRNLILPTVVFFFATIVIGGATVYRKLFVLVVLYLLFAISFDSLRFAQKWMPFDPKHLVFPDTPIINGIKENIKRERMFGNLGAHGDVYYSFSSIEGYDPLYIARYGELMRSASTGELLKPERSVVRLDRNGKYTDRILDLLNVELIFHPIPDTYQGWAYPVWRDKNRFSLVFKDDKFQLFRNNSALPRASLFYEYNVENNKEKILNKLFNDKFDFRKTLILEEKPLFVTSSKNFSDEAKIVTYSANKVILNVVTSHYAMLFLSDNYYPGWIARVDGKETKIYRANYSFRAIEVDKGKHKVEFLYKPSSFAMGVFIAIVSSITIIVIILKSHFLPKIRKT